MKGMKICTFVANDTHACIVANNFVIKWFKEAKVIYINEESENNITINNVNKYFKRMNKKIIYMEWLNEYIINDYDRENIVLVVSGRENYINRVNKYVKLIENDVVVINCYNICSLKSSVESIIDKHEYYLNTEGIYIKKV